MLKKINRLSLTTQFVGLATILSAVTVLTLSSVTGRFVENNLEARSREGLHTRANMIKQQVDNGYGTAQRLVERAYGSLQRSFRGGFELRGNTLYSGGRAVDQTDFRVDEFAKESEGVATVFLKSGDDFVRVSTSLKDENGQKAIGSALDKKSHAYLKLSKGESHVGAAKLFGKNYATKYAPITSNGQIIGALFVGFDVTDIHKQMEQAVEGFRYKGAGRSYMLTQDLVPYFVPGDTKLPDSKTFAPLASQKTADFEADGIIYVAEKLESWGGVYLVATVPHANIVAEGRQLAWLSMAGGVVASIILACLMFVVFRAKIRPLVQLGNELERVGAGDLNISLRYEENSANEVHRMTRSVSNMVENIRKVVGDIKSESTAVAETAEGLASTAKQLTSAAECQAAGASAMGSSVEEMTVSIHSMTDSAHQVADAARSTQDLVTRGEAAVDCSVERMLGIEQHVEQAAKAIETLGEHSKNIALVLSVINDIAGQTNLLALNAAIEAARAGEQGRGFAVVADEVRKLAVRTAESTQEISVIINNIQKGTAGAIETMGETVKQVHAGVEQVREAGHTIHGVSVGAKQAVSAADEIATALREQAQASSLIAQETERVNQTAEETHEAVVQTAGAAQNLQKMADRLHTSVAYFQV